MTYPLYLALTIASILLFPACAGIVLQCIRRASEGRCKQQIREAVERIARAKQVEYSWDASGPVEG